MLTFVAAHTISVNFQMKKKITLVKLIHPRPPCSHSSPSSPPSSFLPSSLSSSPPPPAGVCVETQPTVQQMNNLAVCVSSVYRANPSVSRHLSIRACLVIVHPCYTHTQMRIHKHTHTRTHYWRYSHACFYMMSRLAHIQILQSGADHPDTSYSLSETDFRVKVTKSSDIGGNSFSSV